MVDIDSLTCLTDLATLSFYMARDPWTHLLIRTEHLQLLHAGPLCYLPLYLASTILLEDAVSYAPLPKIVSLVVANSQSHSYHPTPGPIFDKVGIDYAGLSNTIWQTHDGQNLCLCVFVSLAVKAILHLELVTD